MLAYLVNNETIEVFTFQYIPDEVGWNRRSEFDTAKLPQQVMPPITWNGVGGRSYRIDNLILDGDRVREKVAMLEKWLSPAAGKKSPPLCVIQIGALTPINGVLKRVEVEYPTDRFTDAGVPTRARIGITFEQSIPIA